MSLGIINTYKVLRETDIGYIIYNEYDEYFLHYNECNKRKLSVGEEVEAFVYLDKKNRLAATLFSPKITLDKSDFCEVVETSEAGVFVDIGISKDILLSQDDLPLDKSKWPIVGDKVCSVLKIKNMKLLIKMLTKDDMLKHQKPENKLSINSKVEAYVYRITNKGINLIDLNYNVIFVYYKNMRKNYRIGEKVEVTIIHINQDDYTGTLIDQKELMIDYDAEIILKYLQQHNGVMNYTSKTSAEIIYKVFNMSKLSFKRALGRLYKQKKVLLKEDKTILL